MKYEIPEMIPFSVGGAFVDDPNCMFIENSNSEGIKRRYEVTVAAGRVHTWCQELVPGFTPGQVEIEWRPNELWERTLRLWFTHPKKILLLDEETGILYPMFPEEYRDILPKFKEGRIHGMWRFEKRIISYGLVLDKRRTAKRRE